MELRLLAAVLAALEGVAGVANEGAPARGGEDVPYEDAAAPTFSEHVAPIVFRHCLPCHRAGESAPFPLVEHADVAKRAGQIATVVRSRYMPPWLPSAGAVAFVGERRLSDAEIATLERWAAVGAPEGDPALLPRVPPAAEGWHLGEPDLVVSMPAPFVVPAEGLDVFRNVVLPVPAESARFVDAVELRSDNPRVIHHAVLRVDRTTSSRELDARDVAPGFDGMEMGLSEAPDGQFVGWTPGKFPLRSPPGMAWTLRPGTDLVVQLHLVPSGRPEPVRVSIGLFFTDVPPEKRSMVLRLRNDDIDIPPGARDHVVEDALVLNRPIAVTKVYPHAHFLGKRIEVLADPPDGGRVELLRIEDWDFYWQDEYQYATPVRLPSGTRLTMRYTFDNSAENPRNPRVPPQRVRFGNRSLDEMATLTLQVLADSPKDRKALTEAVCRHRVERYPDYWSARLNLGAILAEQGKLEEAAVHLRAGLALEPSSVDLQMNLGAVLASLGDVPEAMRCFREALRLSPGNAEVHSNLALVETMRGRWSEAAEHYRSVLVARPMDAAAQRGLGTALIRLDRPDEAAAALERAAALDPLDHVARCQLAALAVREGRLEEATAAYLAALEIRPISEAHAGLARVYEARGMRAEAERHAREAERLEGQRRLE